MVPQQVSLVERLSLSQRVPYQRFHCTCTYVYCTSNSDDSLFSSLVSDDASLQEGEEEKRGGRGEVKIEKVPRDSPSVGRPRPVVVHSQISTVHQTGAVV